MSGSVGASAEGATAETITKSSGSNLALAFIALPRQKRMDMAIFYGFCRVVDDLADEPGLHPAERLRELDRWKLMVAGPTDCEPALAAQVRELIARYSLPLDYFVEIIFGCEMDVRGTNYETWEELQLYCHRVASVVGLVSIEIFGYEDPQTKTYAAQLGLALQLTNIIRDVGQDYTTNGRIYLPRADLDQFGYDIGSLALRQEDAAFRALMEFEADRARSLYASAREALPAADRRSMVAAEIMRVVYSYLLEKIARDGFHVLSRTYRLSRWEKIRCVLRGRWGRG
jgi:phytoene synthase